jgi:hypothetical protein
MNIDSLANLSFYVFIWVVVLSIVLLAFLGIGYLILQWVRFRNREEVSLNFVTLQVAVPRDNEVKIDAAEQIYAALHSLKKGGFWQRFGAQHHLSFEIIAKKEDIRFYVSVHRDNYGLIEKQIAGSYPGAEVKEVEEPNIFTADGKVDFAQLQLKGKSYEPIKTFKDMPTDPLSSITASMARLGENEAAAVQIIITPAESDWQKMGSSFLSATKKDEADPEKAKFKMSPEDFAAIDHKVSKPGFLVAVRLVSVAPTESQAKANLSNIKGAFSQFSTDKNGFTGKGIRFKQGFMKDFIYRHQSMFGDNSVLNTEELATLWHLPNKTVETPHIYWLSAKLAPATGGIPTSGLYLGKSIYRGQERPIYLSDEDRMRHMYVLGRTGTGKTEFLKAMIQQDMKAGHGLCFLEPHGDAIEELLELVPPERAQDVIVFDPADVNHPMGFNLLEVQSEEEMHFVASSIINLMYKLYDPHKTGIIGPRFEHAVRNAILTAGVIPGATFIEVVRILQNAQYVQEILPKVKDPIVKRYWTEQIAQTSDFHKSETLDYIVSKFGRFITNKLIRNVIGQSKSAFSIREVMDKQKILFIKLAKGLLGEEDANFLGLVLVPKILAAALSRQDLERSARTPFYFYVDEFQNFATPDFAQILSEARKYGLSLTVANQFVSQLDDEVKNAIFGNVGSMVVYRMGAADANIMAQEFSPVFNEADLTNIPFNTAYVKTIVQGTPVPPFSMNVWRDLVAEKARGSKEVADMIKELSRLKFGQDREVVEMEIEKRGQF